MNSTERLKQALTQSQEQRLPPGSPTPATSAHEPRESAVTEFVILDSGSVVQIKRERGAGEGKLARGVSLRLTERDYEILHFLFDQKFASLEALYYRFFDCRKSLHELPPREFFVARQRLGLLKRGGLILTQRVYSEAKSVYLLSRLGLKALQGKLTRGRLRVRDSGGRL